MRTIDADNLANRKFAAEDVSYARVEGWYRNGWNDAIDTIMEDEPSVPLPDFKEGYKQAIRDGKTNFSRPHGECKTCSHRDPEDKKCDCGGLERVGCQFPVSDDYYCKYYERRTWNTEEVNNEQY